MSESCYLRLLLPSEDADRAVYHVNTHEEPLWGLGPLGRVNLFVGSTNSGKSRLMRSIMNQAQYEYHERDEYLRSVGVAIAKLRALFGALRGVTIKFDYHAANNLVRRNDSDTSVFSVSHQRNGSSEWTQVVINDNVIQGLSNLAVTSPDPNPDVLHRYVVSAVARFDQLSKILESALLIGDAKPTSDEGRLRINRIGELRDVLKSFGEQILKYSGAKLKMSAPQPVQPRKVYIPVLRSANTLARPQSTSIDGDIFEQTVQRNYSINPGAKHAPVVCTGQKLYGEITLTRSSALEIRDRHEDFEEFLSATFFSDDPVQVVARADGSGPAQRQLTITVRRIERALPHVGDGIQSLMIIMYELFRADPGTHFFIEEPENSLHPGLQRIMLETMLTHPVLREKNLRIFMTTHSNHLVDLSIRNYEDVSIFVFEKFMNKEAGTEAEHFLVRSANNARMHAVASLGALNSSVLMANCSVWIEGVTDRKYIRAYLDAYWKSDEYRNKNDSSAAVPFREDIHFAFFEYAGSNLAHYVFDNGSASDDPDVDDDKIKMQFIANRVFLVADRDDDRKNAKHAEWRAKSSDDFVYYVTPGREVENMISAKLLKAVLADGFISKPEVTLTQEKIDMITDEAYKEEGLGKFLVDHFDIKSGVRAKNGGTLDTYYKNRLADQITRHLRVMLQDPTRERDAWDWLSPEAQELARQIDVFIRKHNLTKTV